MKPTSEQLFASCTPGLEPALHREAAALGLRPAPEKGGVTLCGPPGTLQEANLRLRTASRVLLRVGHVSADDERTLARSLAGLSLEEYRAPGTGLEVQVTAHRSRLRPARIEQLARGAWGRGDGARREKSSLSPFLDVLIRVEGGACTVSVDTSGELLHVRGYRQEIGRAPLRETLAAGLLLLAGYDGSAPLWDPMCGSGTLAIEAALIATRTAPGLRRTFAFETWPSHDPRAYSELKARLSAESLPRAPQPILATDLNSGALGTARRNARRAGLLEELSLERRDVRALAATPASAGLAPGLLVANLPYGKRVGARSETPELLRALGAALAGPLLGWRFALLLAEWDAAAAPEHLGRSPREVFSLSNGGIPCRLLVS